VEDLKNSRLNRTNNKTKKKKIKNTNNEVLIESAILNKKGLSNKEKASILNSMSRQMEENKVNNQDEVQEIPQNSIDQKSDKNISNEMKISLTIKEISETIENNSEINEEEAKEILELMKNSQEELIEPDNEKSKRSTIICSAACFEQLTEENYIDHVLDCEIQIEDCWR
jgi:hypothetical protein